MANILSWTWGPILVYYIILTQKSYAIDLGLMVSLIDDKVIYTPMAINIKYKKADG